MKHSDRSLSYLAIPARGCPCALKVCSESLLMLFPALESIARIGQHLRVGWAVRYCPWELVIGFPGGSYSSLSSKSSSSAVVGHFERLAARKMVVLALFVSAA